MKRYSKRVREEAALICAIAASNRDMNDWYGGVADETGIQRQGEAFDLAIAAWCHALPASGALGPGELDAEAEALIRTGWTP